MDSTHFDENAIEAIPDVVDTQMSSGARQAIEFWQKNDHRQTTDKYWTGFFVVIFISWIVSWQYVLNHQADYNVLSGSTPPNNTLQFVPHKTGYNRGISGAKTLYKLLNHPKYNESNPGNETITQKKNMTLNDFVSFIIDAYTCNPSRLVASIEMMGYLAVLGHVFIGGNIFWLSLINMHVDKVFWNKPLVVVTALLFATLFVRMSAYYQTTSSTAFIDRRLIVWIVPETLLFFMWYSDMKFIRPRSESDGKSPEPSYGYSISTGIIVSVILNSLATSTIRILHNLAWNSFLFCVIAGGSCYVGLTIYYFGLMVISCANRFAIEDPESLSFFRALCIVARYHFGSACYQASLIFPRLQATFIMKDPRLRTLSKCSVIDRFRMAHWHAHSLSIPWTGVFGTNYSTSLRHVLRFRSTNVIIKERIWNHFLLFLSTLGFLLSINGLMILLYWYLGANDSRLSQASWLMYIKIMVIFYLAIPYFNAASYATEFWMYRKLLREFSGDAYQKRMFEQYFAEFWCSDCAAGTVPDITWY